MSDIETLIDADTIQAKVRELGAQITDRYRGKELVLVPVLKGSFVFAADLARAIELPLTVDFFGVRSYEGEESTGVVETTLDLSKPIRNKHVLIVEDIVDTGLTMKYMLENFETRRPASLELVSLLHKPARTQVKVDIDYLGFTIEDVFVIGYGLDFDQRYRNLPYLGVLAS
ncbi:MAG TPA: hypoxanthine phosphoribosyltransferase [Sandaracinaceae bacterium LLY-WYZ-13_1]|nr:hypoxanthine phosphoribosyltransferase [Sandaracinaceae bacterium LLY-WYZ-13_1]